MVIKDLREFLIFIEYTKQVGNSISFVFICINPSTTTLTIEWQPHCYCSMAGSIWTLWTTKIVYNPKILDFSSPNTLGYTKAWSHSLSGSNYRPKNLVQLQVYGLLAFVHKEPCKCFKSRNNIFWQLIIVHKFPYILHTFGENQLERKYHFISSLFINEQPKIPICMVSFGERFCK